MISSFARKHAVRIEFKANNYHMNFLKDRNALGFALLGAVFFLPFLGGVHLFDWDEINFAEIAREMVVLNDYLRVHINFEPFHEKPPLFFWLQAFSMNLFGVGEYAARFPNAVCGIITLVLLYDLGKKLYNKSFGILWAGAYFGTILPHLYFKSGIIDPYFNLFIFLGLYHLIFFYWKKDKFEDLPLRSQPWVYLVLAGVFTGLGVMTKGPVAYLIIGLALGVYWVMQRFRFYITPLQFIGYTFFMMLAISFWYGIETIVNGPEFAKEFIIRQYEIFSQPDAGHGGFPGYHFVVFLIGSFPACIFCIRAFFGLKDEHDYQADFRRWMMILFWVVMILFTIVKSKIVHYSSMTYFPLTYLAALVIYRIMERKVFFDRWMQAGLIGVGLIWSAVTIALPFVGMNIEAIQEITADEFAKANMDADVAWRGVEGLVGVFYLFIIIYAIRQIKAKKWQRGFGSLFLGTAIFVQSVLFVYINNIEAISQRASIEFFKDLDEENCYVVNKYYRTYASLFYFNKPKPENPNALDDHWLLTSPEVDKDVYVVIKIFDVDKLLQEYPNLTRIGDKNGFVFFRRNR